MMSEESESKSFLDAHSGKLYIGYLILLVIGGIFFYLWAVGKIEGYHNNDPAGVSGLGSGYSVWFHEQEPSCHYNCDGDITRPGYKDSINRDYLYRAYQANTSPYAYDNTRFCTSHYYNTCDGRRSGSRAANMGKWKPILITN